MSIQIVTRRNDDGARMHRNEQSLKRAAAIPSFVRSMVRARDSGSCSRPAEGHCRDRRGNAVDEVPGAELCGAMRLGGQAEAEFEDALAGRVHDKHAVRRAVVERDGAAQHRASVGEVADAADQRQRWLKRAENRGGWSPDREQRFNCLIVSARSRG
ncbi:hypothetical protein ACVWY3_002793 [Bradyrhizobium sp. USDA 4486]